MMEIKSPTLLLDEKKCRNNIRMMTEKLKKQKVRFRPHFKTHQSIQIGHWFKEAGVNSITVSSLKMADYFATKGWDDITVAFPVNLRETERIKALSKQINLELVVADLGVATRLNSMVNNPVNIWIKTDTGYHRSGIPVEDTNTFEKIIKEIDSSPNLKLKGLLSHTGNTYHTTSVLQIEKLYNEAVKKLTGLKNRFSDRQTKLQLSLGDTPSFTRVSDLSGINEARPGNFVFFDLMQYHLGVCSLDQIAVALACPVVSKKKKEKQVIIHGGAVHFSKESILDKNHRKIYGRVVKMEEDLWKNAGEENVLTALSQEHGTVQLDNKLYESVNIGDLIYILPVHSCLTANLMKGYLNLNGEYLDHLEGVFSY